MYNPLHSSKSLVTQLLSIPDICQRGYWHYNLLRLSVRTHVFEIPVYFIHRFLYVRNIVVG
jgi:hypothetical protein